MSVVQKSPLAALNRTGGAIVRSIRLNVISFDVMEGRRVIIKRRNRFGQCITPIANAFFRVARAPIAFWTNPADWQQFEINTFRMLNPRYLAKAVDAGAICEEKLPGESLWSLLKRGALTRNMLVAAAKEFRRAHGYYSDLYSARWSHGDAAMCNLLYDAEANRARFIDFELHHDLSLSPAKRHADDLLAFLLDLVSLSAEEEWLPNALSFLETYDDAEAVAALCSRLAPFRGIGYFWWKVRTNFSDTRTIARRLKALSQSLRRELPTPQFATRGGPTIAFPQPIAMR